MWPHIVVINVAKHTCSYIPITFHNGEYAYIEDFENNVHLMLHDNRPDKTIDGEDNLELTKKFHIYSHNRQPR